MSERRFPHLPSRPTRIAVYVLAIALMLGINYWGAHRVTQETRIRVPYSPFFLAQVRAGNVVSVTSTVSELQGEFRKSTKPASADQSAQRQWLASPQVQKEGLPFGRMQ